MVLGHWSVVALVALAVGAVALLIAAFVHPRPRSIEAPEAWRSHRFGFATVALIFLAFDMEMIFMYPWGVVFADIGLTAFLDMLVFIALLGGGVTYAWGMRGLQWE